MGPRKASGREGDYKLGSLEGGGLYSSAPLEMWPQEGAQVGARARSTQRSLESIHPPSFHTRLGRMEGALHFLFWQWVHQGFVWGVPHAVQWAASLSLESQ